MKKNHNHGLDRSQPLTTEIRRKTCYIGLLWCFLSGLIGPPYAISAPADAKMRTWTSAAGTELKALFVQMRDGNIVLQGEKGEMFSIRPIDLSAADREYVQTLTAVVEPSIIAAGTNTLAVFKGGDWDGAAAVYTYKFFVFTVSKDGGWKMQILDNGKPVGPILSDGPPVGVYHDKEYKKPDWKVGDPIGRTFGRRLAVFEKRPDRPLMQPDRMELAGLLADNVAFEHIITFNGNKVEIVDKMSDPTGIKYPTRYEIAARVSSSVTFPSGVSWDEIVAALDGHKLIINPPKGASKTVEYKQMLTANIAIKSIEAVGPWGGRTLRITGSPGGGSLRNYANNEPYKGYSVVRGVTGKGSTGIITITVE